MAHIRRKFVEAYDAGRHKDYLKKVIIKIGQLYPLERYATKNGYTIEQRTDLRQKLSRSVLESIKKLLLNPEFSTLPSSLAGNAINYLPINWDEATRFLEWGGHYQSIIQRMNALIVLSQLGVTIGDRLGLKWSKVDGNTILHNYYLQIRQYQSGRVS